MKWMYVLSMALMSSAGLLAQTRLTLREAVEKTIEQNPQMKLATLRTEKQQALLPATFNLDNPELVFEAPTGTTLRPGVLQSFAYPGVYTQQRKVQQQVIQLTKTESKITVNELRYRIKILYNELQYLQEVQLNYQRQDSILRNFSEVTEVRLRVGQISSIELLNAEAQLKEVQNLLAQTKKRITGIQQQINVLLGMPQESNITAADPFKKLPVSWAVSDTAFVTNPFTGFYQQNKTVSEATLKLEKRRMMPGFVVGFLNQGEPRNALVSQLRFGLTLPVWRWSQKARIEAASKDVQIAEQQITSNRFELNQLYRRSVASYEQYNDALQYYEQTGLRQADEIARAGAEAYRLGSIGYYNYLLNLQQVFKVRVDYLEALHNYNQAVYTLQYITGGQE